MNKEEFYEKHCKWCGTQRCPGVLNEDPSWYEECPDYRKEVLCEDIGTVKFIYPESFESFGNLVEPLSLEEAHIDIIPLPARKVLSEFVEQLKSLMTVDVTHPWGFGKLSVDMMEWASLLYKYELPIDKDWLESLSEKDKEAIESGRLLREKKKKENNT